MCIDGKVGASLVDFMSCVRGHITYVCVCVELGGDVALGKVSCGEVKGNQEGAPIISTSKTHFNYNLLTRRQRPQSP